MHRSADLGLDKGPTGVLYRPTYSILLCIEYAGAKKCEMAGSFCIIQNSGKEKQFMFIT